MRCQKKQFFPNLRRNFPELYAAFSRKNRLMPLIDPSDYRPPRWLRGAHAQTIYPALFRKVAGVAYTRERLTLPDGDFLDLDWARPSSQFTVHSSQQMQNQGSQPVNCELPTVNCELAILSHGLEGDSTRQYILGMVRLLTHHGFDCLAWNYRSCSGEMNLTQRFYHSGATDDLHTVVQHARTKGYRRIFLIGFSLGGNLTLKYLGEQGAGAGIERAVVFSVPLHLSSSSYRIEQGGSRVYSRRFNRTLKRKIQEKAARMPEHVSAANLKKVRTLRDFDDLYTSQLHGFRDAEEYYERNSSIHFVGRIAVPTLIVNARNDPFLSADCFPFQKMNALESVWFEAPAEGGHCGFYPADYDGTLWSERRALGFFENNV
jgi:predicted alpha/beta-fold hydrolase